tara:strand:- start:526 stop:642 length:117 start_codon:yes stop_codon:yes gene_type:complete
MIEGFVIHILNIIMKEEMPIRYPDPELKEFFFRGDTKE